MSNKIGFGESKPQENNKPSDYVETVRTFESLDGITMTSNGGGLATMALDGATLGDNGLPVLKVRSNNATATINVLVDLSGYGEGILAGDRKDLGVVIKITESAKISYINMNLSSNSALTNYSQNTRVQSANLTASGGGLYYIPLNNKDWSVGAGTPDSLHLKYLRFNILPLAGNSSGNSFTIEIVRVVKFRPRKSRLMISYDDGHYTNMSIATLLEKYSLKATFYIYNTGIDQGGNITTAQCQDLYARGHDIAVHNDVHSSAGTLGDAAYFAGQQTCRNWIRENIGSRSADHTAFVGGISTPTLIAMMQRAGFKSTRKATPAQYGYVNSGFGIGKDNMWYSPRWLGNTWEMNNTNTVASIIAAHEDAITSGQDFFVYGHQLLATATAQAWSDIQGNPYSMEDYFIWVKAQIDAGRVEAFTVSQFWDGI